MVDTQRFNLGQGCVQTVSAVAREIARRHAGKVYAVEVATYLPMDLESIARILDSLVELDEAAHDTDDEGVSVFTFDDIEDVQPLDIGAEDFLSRSAAFERNLATLRNNADWTRKVRENHELLYIASHQRSHGMLLSEITDKTRISNARTQSILNDMASQSHIAVDLDGDEPRYIFPNFDYPKERFDRVFGKVAELETRQSFRGSWIAFAIGAFLLLALVIALRFY